MLFLLYIHLGCDSFVPTPESSWIAADYEFTIVMLRLREYREKVALISQLGLIFSRLLLSAFSFLLADSVLRKDLGQN